MILLCEWFVMNNGERLKALRHKLGLSVNEMSDLLGLSGNNAADRVREMERSARDVSGSVLNVIRYIEQGAYSELEAFALCKGLTAANDFVMHNHWPRFILKPASKALKRDDSSVIQSTGRELMIIDSETIAVLQWIDEPLHDHKEALQTAIDLLMRGKP